MPFQIVRNDITKMKVDAIVNTANPMPGYGPGIDTAVYEAAGIDKLLEKRKEIGIIECGHSVITDGYGLPAKYIIHTVGTSWKDGNLGEEDVLRNCYRTVFDLTVENKIESLAIPLLASGSYGFPKGIALRIALSEIEAFMSGHDLELFLVIFDEKSLYLSSELYGDIDEYINDNYVEEKSKEEYPPDYRPGSDRRRKALSMDMAPTMSMAQSMLGSGSAFHAMGKASPMPDVKPRKKSRMLFADKKADVVCDSAVIDEDVCMVGAAPDERSLDDVIKNIDKTFMELVFSFADERGISDVELQKKANLDRKAFSKLKCGTTKNPSKSTALALSVALKLSLDDTKDLLSRAGLALSPCSKQDLIVQYFIEREAYDIFEINIALFEHGEPILGCAAG